MEVQRVLCVVGTRPEAVKMAPVIKALQKDERYECIVCSTGQHREMLQQILDWFDITPDYNMNVMTHAQPLAQLAGRIMHGFYDVIQEAKPDIIAVQGDTTTAFVAGLTGFYCFDVENNKRIKIAHIEAGLRTGDRFAPYPEESNRTLIGHIADWHFAPTLNSKESLKKENITKDVYITGNTVIDALFETESMLEKKPRDPLPQIPQDKQIILVTGHRRENYGEGFDNICMALRDLAEKYPDAEFVYPVHLNPHVKEPVTKHLSGIDNIHLISPMDYPDFVAAMMRAHIILTDSGGVQEEAPSLGKPVICLRDVTERPEAVTAGTVKIIGPHKDAIVNSVSELMDDDAAYKKMAHAVNPYGDGKAVERILNLMAGESSEDNCFEYDEDSSKADISAT